MFKEGQQIGGYRLVKKIGKGGFGEVWLAEKQTRILTTKVAIKLPHDDQIDLETVRREAILWEQASGHPNVLPIIDADIYDGQVLIVSEYASGGSLSDKLKSVGALTAEEAVKATIGILQGLDFLHRKNIIHRDIKPQNILLQDGTPRLADFGISRAMNTSSVSVTISGTDAYMAPEAFDGKRNIQTDIWSVGVVLYQLLQNRLPFPQNHPTERMFAVLHKEFEPFSPEVPENLRRIVSKALAKDAGARYQSAGEMREDLETALVNIKHPGFAPPEVLEKGSSSIPGQTGEGIKQTILQDIAAETPLTRAAITLEKPFVAKPGENVSIETNIAIPETRIAEEIIYSEQSNLKNRAKKRNAKPFFYIGAAVLALAILSGLAGLVWFIRHRQQIAAAESMTLIPFRKGKQWGFSDVNKKIIIAAVYDQVSRFKDGVAIVRKDNKDGLIDKLGNEVTPLKYFQIMSLNNGAATVTTMPYSKWGFIDKNGREIVPLIYDYTNRFSEDLAAVGLNGKTGFIDKQGKTVIPIKYENADDFVNGLAPVKLNGKWGYINKADQTIIPFIYDEADTFNDDLARVKKNDKYGFIDKSGAEIIDFQYNSVTRFGNGAAYVSDSGRTGFINKANQLTATQAYSCYSSFSEGLMPVCLGSGKFGFVDTSGKVVISVEHGAGNFQDGIAYVPLTSTFDQREGYYIDRSGTEYFEP